MREATAQTQSYSLAQLRQLLGLSRHAIARLIELGFVEPSRGPGRLLQFSFQDLVLLRSAHDLRNAGMATRQILRSLAELRAALPSDVPLSGLRVMAMGDRIAVRPIGAFATPWEPGSGQLVMDFGVAASGDLLSFPGMAGAAEAPERQADGDDVERRFQAAEALEETDSAAAESAYREVLALAPDHAHAYLNLGFMMCEAERFAEAADLYESGARRCPDDPLIHFNRGVALEALQRGVEALACYERALQLQPDLADAHQNAALLCSELGQDQLAIRHFSAYRRLQRTAR